MKGRIFWFLFSIVRRRRKLRGKTEKRKERIKAKS